MRFEYNICVKCKSDKVLYKFDSEILIYKEKKYKRKIRYFTCDKCGFIAYDAEGILASEARASKYFGLNIKDMQLVYEETKKWREQAVEKLTKPNKSA